MNRNCILEFTYLFLSALILFSCSEIETSVEGFIDEDSPNIIVLVVDDAIWNDFEPYCNDIIQTPGINKLAEEDLTVDKALILNG